MELISRIEASRKKGEGDPVLKGEALAYAGKFKARHRLRAHPAGHLAEPAAAWFRATAPLQDVVSACRSGVMYQCLQVSALLH